MASSITLQGIVNSIRAYPQVTPVLGVSGWSQEPALTIANDVMQRILSEPFNWKFNRAAVPSFYTVALQQDYITSITGMGWLEQGWRIDINNTATPKPVFALETAKDLVQTSFQGYPFTVSWVPNSLAIFGTWQANTSYPTGFGAASTPTSPIQQIIDGHGNYLRVTTNGTSGSTPPLAPASAPVGTTVPDGTVVWTVTDPNGIALRLAPLPAAGGLTWQMNVLYQKRPPTLTSLQNTIDPIPDDYAYLFRQGFVAKCYEHSGSKQGADAYAKWEEALAIASRSADRERDDSVFYPSRSIMGGRGYVDYLPIGPGWPYVPYGY